MFEKTPRLPAGEFGLDRRTSLGRDDISRRRASSDVPAPIQLSERRILAERRRERREMAERMREAARRLRGNSPPLPVGEPPLSFVDMLVDFLRAAIETGLWKPDRGELPVNEFCRQTAMQVGWQWPFTP